MSPYTHATRTDVVCGAILDVSVRLPDNTREALGRLSNKSTKYSFLLIVVPRYNLYWYQLFHSALATKHLRQRTKDSLGPSQCVVCHLHQHSWMPNSPIRHLRYLFWQLEHSFNIHSFSTTFVVHVQRYITRHYGRQWHLGIWSYTINILSSESKHWNKNIYLLLSYK